MAGWMLMLGGGIGLSWLANPLFLLSILLPENKLKLKLAFALLALLFAIYFLLFDECMISSAGTMYPIIKYNIGYFIWQLSLSINLIFIIIKLINSFRK